MAKQPPITINMYLQGRALKDAAASLEDEEPERVKQTNKERLLSASPVIKRKSAEEIGDDVFAYQKSKSPDATDKMLCCPKCTYAGPEDEFEMGSADQQPHDSHGRAVLEEDGE